MILMIDNYDSFTYNIVQYCLELGADLKIIRNDELTLKQIEDLNPQKIIISPGPATPDDAGVCLDVIKYFAGKKPIFGIKLQITGKGLAKAGIRKTEIPTKPEPSKNHFRFFKFTKK